MALMRQAEFEICLFSFFYSFLMDRLEKYVKTTLHGGFRDCTGSLKPDVEIGRTKAVKYLERLGVSRNAFFYRNAGTYT